MIRWDAFLQGPVAEEGFLSDIGAAHGEILKYLEMDIILP
jgi:hypothetical protein